MLCYSAFGAVPVRARSWMIRWLQEPACRARTRSARPPGSGSDGAPNPTYTLPVISQGRGSPLRVVGAGKAAPTSPVIRLTDARTTPPWYSVVESPGLSGRVATQPTFYQLDTTTTADSTKEFW